MSYCRWSSDNWRCDLYCYEDCAGGYITHVAGRHLKNPEILPQLPLKLTLDNLNEWHEIHNKQLDLLENAEYEPIGLPYDNETFNDPDLQSFLERVISLKGMGYHVPNYVIEDIKEELATANTDEEPRQTRPREGMMGENA